MKHFEVSDRIVRINATAILPSKQPLDLHRRRPYALFWRRLFPEPADNVPLLQSAVVTFCIQNLARLFASSLLSCSFLPSSVISTWSGVFHVTWHSFHRLDLLSLYSLTMTPARVRFLSSPKLSIIDGSQRKRQVCKVHNIWKKASSCLQSNSL